MTDGYRVPVPMELIDYVKLNLKLKIGDSEVTETVELRSVGDVAPSLLEIESQLSTNEWVLKPDVTEWLHLNLVGEMKSEEGNRDLTLVFSDLNDATHFKLRWLG